MTMSMNDRQKQPDEVISRFNGLKAETMSLMLGTVGKQGLPRTSYAPFVLESGNFYIYLSGLSEHTAELIANPVASILLIEDEAAADQIFARARVSYMCDSGVIERDGSKYEHILGLFSARFGGVIDVLKSLPDFVLFELTPRSGRFITGFGQAYDLSGDQLDILEHIGPDQIRGSTGSKP